MTKTDFERRLLMAYRVLYPERRTDRGALAWFRRECYAYGCGESISTIRRWVKKEGPPEKAWKMLDRVENQARDRLDELMEGIGK